MGIRWAGMSPKQLGQAWVNADKAVRRRARAVFREEVEKIKDISVENSPVDDGELEQAHSVVVRRANQHNLGLSIEVGGVVNGVDVSAYAWFIHDGDWQKLGPMSVLKQQGQMRRVGKKYLERAYEEREKALIEAVADALGAFR